MADDKDDFSVFLEDELTDWATSTFDPHQALSFRFPLSTDTAMNENQPPRRVRWADTALHWSDTPTNELRETSPAMPRRVTPRQPSPPRRRKETPRYRYDSSSGLLPFAPYTDAFGNSIPIDTRPLTKSEHWTEPSPSQQFPSTPRPKEKSREMTMPPRPYNFLEWYPEGKATLTFQNDKKELESIRGLDVDIIGECSTFLAMAFEESRSGPQLFLETLTSATALPFVRFLYTSTYAPGGPQDSFYEDVPTSVLFHCQLYRLGDIYDIEGLMTQAYVNVLRQCEFACCSPDKPIDLCDAIRYMYANLSKHEKLIGTVLDYCVTRFIEHRLGRDAEFTKLAYELRPFHQALCKCSRDRGYEHDAASAIIQLPFKPYKPDTYASREDITAVKRYDDDIVFHFHARDELDDLAETKKRKRPEASSSKTEPSAELPLRIRNTVEEQPVQTLSEEEGIENATKRRASVVLTESLRSAPIPASHWTKQIFPLRGRLRVVNVTDDDADLRTPDANPVKIESNFDSDFEVVPGPSAVEALSDSESDSGDIVKVEHEDTKPDAPLPPSDAGTAASAASQDSDSEWQLV